jgi:hypothetical protein
MKFVLLNSSLTRGESREQRETRDGRVEKRRETRREERGREQY